MRARSSNGNSLIGNMGSKTMGGISYGQAIWALPLMLVLLHKGQKSLDCLN